MAEACAIISGRNISRHTTLYIVRTLASRILTFKLSKHPNTHSYESPINYHSNT